MRHPRARNTDPATSHAAADSAGDLAESHQAIILDVLGRRELGAEEIADACGLHPYEVRKRLPELGRMGFVSLTGKTRKTSSGRVERVWVAL